SGSFAICMRGTKCDNRIRIENNTRRRSRFRGGIDLRGIESVGLTVCTSDIRALAATAIDLSGSTIHGDVRFAANVQVEATLNLRAEIAADVEFCQANLHALGQTAVDLSRAHVAGHILIDQRSRIEGSVLLGARSDGNVTVGNATIIATGMTAFSLE